MYKVISVKQRSVLSILKFEEKPGEFFPHCSNEWPSTWIVEPSGNTFMFVLPSSSQTSIILVM